MYCKIYSTDRRRSRCVSASTSNFYRIHLRSILSGSGALRSCALQPLAENFGDKFPAEIGSNVQNASLVVLSGAFALTNLETLAVHQFEPTAQDIVRMLLGRNNLRVLVLVDINDCDNCDPETLHVIPLSIDRLRIKAPPQRSAPAYNQCLHIIGGLPNIKELELM